MIEIMFHIPTFLSNKAHQQIENKTSDLSAFSTLFIKMYFGVRQSLLKMWTGKSEGQSSGRKNC